MSSFKILDTRTGLFVEDIEVVITHNGVLKEVEYRGYGDYQLHEMPSHLKSVFPHEERELEFVQRPGETFADMCNRLWPVDSRLFYDYLGNNTWRIYTVDRPFTQHPSGEDKPAKAWFKEEQGSSLFEMADVEFNKLHPIKT